MYLEDSRVRINCSISSQTSQDSQHAVLWYVRRATGSEADELLLRIERSGAFEYGAYADEERLRRRVQAERLSPRLYVLTLNRAESSDSGTYYCLVEEWLSDPDGAWYRLSRDSSGFTRVLVRQPGERVVRRVVVFNKILVCSHCREAAADWLTQSLLLIPLTLLPTPTFSAQGIKNVMLSWFYTCPGRSSGGEKNGLESCQLSYAMPEGIAWLKLRT